MRKTLKSILFLLVFFTLGEVSANAANNSINAYFFHYEGCPHCKNELKFLQKMQKKHPSLKIVSFEVKQSKRNADLLQRVGKSFNADIGGLPFLVIGDKYFIGYLEGVTSIEIESKIIECEKKGYLDHVGPIIDLSIETDQKDSQKTTHKKIEKIIKLPFLGKTDVCKGSLLILTVIMGLLDGFNPCAMWCLIFLISLLLGMKNKKRMWFFGATFIFASGFVYFMFMTAWLNLFLFLGFIVFIRIIIGLMALFAGGYRLKEFFFDKEKGCKVTGSQSRQKYFQKIKSIVAEKSFWLSFGGIVILAFMVNLVELICSAGLPAVYTQVLALNNLSSWQYYLYILLYIFFYMLDDLLVFIIAMITLEITGLSTKYLKYSQLFGGLIMLIIGIFLIFKPEWLMFG